MADGDEWIKMTHPQIPHTKDEPVAVHIQAFKHVWKDLGWTEDQPTRTTTTTSTTTPKE